MNAFSNMLVKLALEVAAKAPGVADKVRDAVRPYLHAKARLTVRLDVVTDGPNGPLPDPVFEVTQAARLDADGVHPEGVPQFSAALTGAKVAPPSQE